MKKVRDEAVRADLLHDLNALSIAWSPENSTAARALFFNKWEAVADPVTLQVISHFKTNWNRNHLAKWSRCDAPNCVVNNNGLEATNKVLKDDVTQRQLLPVITFFTVK